MIRMQPEIPMRDQRYQESCYQYQMYQPVIGALSPNPTAHNIFNMRCFTEYENFTQRELKPILVFLYKGDDHGLLKRLVSLFSGTETRLLVVDVNRIPSVAYNYRNVIGCFPTLAWTIRGKVLRIFQDFSSKNKLLAFATSTNTWRNKGFYRTTQT